MLCLLLIAFLAGVSVPEGPLTIVSFKRVPTEVAGSIPVEVVLKNRSDRPIRLWAPNNYEGMVSVRFLIKDGSGKETPYQPPVPPRAGGIPTAVSLAPRRTLALAQVDVGDCRRKLKLKVGRYELTAVYKNDLAEMAPVTGVWTGTLRSKPIRIQF